LTAVKWATKMQKLLLEASWPEHLTKVKKNLKNCINQTKRENQASKSINALTNNVCSCHCWEWRFFFVPRFVFILCFNSKRFFVLNQLETFAVLVA